MHGYVVDVLCRLNKCGPMTWYHVIRLGWAPGEYHKGKAAVRRRVLLRAIDKGWIVIRGDKLVITPCGGRELYDALRTI